jgi:two-component system cell cycle response regulator DivK
MTIMRKPVTSINESLNVWTNKTIMIVEDVDSNYSYLAATLRKSGAQLIWAKSGEDALQLITDGVRPDLVLMDVQLSGIDGYKVTEMIKEKLPNLPIIAQTAYAMVGEKEKSSIAGCDDYLPKPIRPGQLLETISKYL